MYANKNTQGLTKKAAKAIAIQKAGRRAAEMASRTAGWSIGDKCFWRDDAGMVHQGVVKTLLPTGLLGVAKKGELQWNNAVDPTKATKTLEAI